MGKRHYLTALIALLLVATGEPPRAAGLRDVLDRLDGSAAPGQREFLDPEVAFVLTAETTTGPAVRVVWTIAPGYYLYRDKMKFDGVAEGFGLAEPILPAGELKDDPAFGQVEIYKSRVAVEVPIVSVPPGVDHALMRVSYQGCAEDGICYPPIKKDVSVSLGVQRGAAVATGPAPVARTGALSESDRIAERLARGSVAATVASFYVFGLLLAFTPCVFPMVPILSGIIIGQGETVTVRRGLLLSFVYVAAMAAAYAIAGLAAGLFGQNLQAAFQQPVIVVAFSGVFVLLALSMFGFFELQLPARWQTRLDALSRSRAGGTYAGVAAMGLFSAIIVGPCVAAPLAGALVYIGHQGNPLLGGLALFVMGLGMGTPLLALGASAGTLLPGAGAWMESLNRSFGVVMLGVAIWFLERVLPAPLTMFLWATLAVATAIYMGALDELSETTTGWPRLRKGLGIALLGYGLVLMAGAGAGASDPLRPLAPLSNVYQGTSASSVFSEVKGVAGLDTALAAARRTGKPVLLDFYADWCIECKHLERGTFQADAVRREFDHWTLLRADVTANDDDDRTLLRSLELYGPPAIALFDADGTEHRDRRIVGFVAAADFAAHLKATRLP